MKAIFIDHPEISKEIILQIFEEHGLVENDQILFVSNYYFICETINSIGFNATTVAELLDNNDIVDADGWVERICQNWFKDSKGNDLSYYNGISLGSISETPVWIYIVMPLARIITVINKLVKLGYKTIFLDHNLHYASEIKQCLTNSIDVQLISCDYKPIPELIKGTIVSYLTSSRQKPYKTIIKSLAWFILNSVNTFRKAKNCKSVLFFAESYLTPFFEFTKSQELNFNLCFIEHKRPNNFSVRELSNKKIVVIPTPIRFKKNKLGSFEEINSNLKKTKVFIYNDIDYNSLFVPFLLEFAKNYWPLFQQATSYYEKMILKWNISVLFVYADTPTFERMLCLIAKKHCLLTAVIQHGFKDYPQDLDMDTVDYVLVWSEETKRDYLSLRHNEYKGIITGNPLFEAYIRTEESMVYNRAILILAHSFYNLSNFSQYSHQEVYLRTAINFVKKTFPDYEIIFRPHPGEELAVYQKYIFPKLKEFEDVEIDTERPIDKSFKRCSIVICANSTGGIEAFLAGKTVYVINVSNRRFNYPFDEASPSNGKILRDYNPAKLEQSDYFSNIKNGASKRLLDTITIMLNKEAR